MKTSTNHSFRRTALGLLFGLTAGIFPVSRVCAQAPPQAINYQAVARDAGGNLITTPLTVRISIRSGAASGPVVYQETHNTTPNTYGLFNLSIGQGTPGTGSFGAIDWSAGAYFAQVELNTGSGFQNMGTQQMLSVPYALYAGKAGSVNLSLNDLTDVNTAGVTAGQVLKWDGSQWTPANDVGGGAGDNWGTQVVQTTATLSGNGTSSNPLTIAQQGATNGQVLKWNGTTWAPAADTDTDTDAQTLSLSGNTLSISGGNSVNLPTGADNWGTQVVQTTATLSGNGTSSSPLTIAQQGAANGQVLKWNGTTWAPAADNNTTYTAGSGISISGTTISATDASATNEIQTLSLSGTTLTLSNGGGSVTLPTGADNWGTQVAQTTARLTGNGTSASPLDIAQQGAANGQVLKWNGTTWAPAADNNTTYTAGSGISISGTTISATDASATNEIQTLSLSGTTLTLSNGGGSVNLPTGADNWGTQVVQTTATLSGNGTSSSPLTIAQQGATNGQVLKWNGTTWVPAADNDAQTLSLSGTTLSISGGNNVNLNTVLNNAWQIGGNSGTNPANHFIGTTDNQPLNFRANNEKAGRIGLIGDGSTFFGYQAGNSDDASNNWNTFIGYKAGFNATSADDNVGVGHEALLENTTGSYNTAVGTRALYSNTTGNFNTASGRGALFSNTTGSYNTASGRAALSSNTIGSSNTASGVEALAYNTTGSYNTASGRGALYYNTSGFDNTASGFWALYSNTTGSTNTAIGSDAGSFNDANNACSFFGNDADQSVLTDFTNSTALGNTSRITASDQVRVGNSSVTSIGGYANWTNVSDGRYKKDVQENVPGLDFILRLRPVTYHLDVTGIARFLGEGEFSPESIEREGERKPDEKLLALERQSRAEKEKILYTGFIAQEVEKTARELGYDFSGVDKPHNEHSLYGLRYAEFVVPLVKAVQEQQKIIEEQKAEIAFLKNTLETSLKTLNQRIDALQQQISTSSAR